MDTQLEQRIAALLEGADTLYNYPGEKTLERLFPLADRITDYVCAVVLVVEQVMDPETPPEEKRAEAVGLVMLAWDAAPIPAWVKNLARGIVQEAVAYLVDAVVAYLNKTLGHAFMASDGVAKALGRGAPGALEASATANTHTS